MSLDRQRALVVFDNPKNDVRFMDVSFSIAGYQIGAFCTFFKWECWKN